MSENNELKNRYTHIDYDDYMKKLENAPQNKNFATYFFQISSLFFKKILFFI